MASRTDLHNKLKELLGSDNVYFQPPPTKQLEYPAIVYSIGGMMNHHANGTVYYQDISYEITVIDKNPDNDVFKRISQLPKCVFNRHFKSENLNHYIFTLYY